MKTLRCMGVSQTMKKRSNRVATIPKFLSVVGEDGWWRRMKMAMMMFDLESKIESVERRNFAGVQLYVLSWVGVSFKLPNWASAPGIFIYFFVFWRFLSPGTAPLIPLRWTLNHVDVSRPPVSAANEKHWSKFFFLNLICLPFRKLDVKNKTG